MTNPFRITVTIHGSAESFRRRSGAWEGQQKEAFLVSSVAGTKAERREKDRLFGLLWLDKGTVLSLNAKN